MYSPCAVRSLARQLESWSHLKFPALYLLSRSVGYWEQRFLHTVQCDGVMPPGGGLSRYSIDSGVVPSNKSLEQTRGR